jgi:hypothetical protein
VRSQSAGIADVASDLAPAHAFVPLWRRAGDSRSLSPPMNRAIELACILALSGVACHAPDSSSTSTDAGGPAANASTVAATAAAAPGGVIDVCATLSAADMAQASGRPIVRAEKSPFSECTYQTKETMGLEYIVRVAVLHGIHIGGSKQNAPNYMKVMRATDTVSRFAPAVDVPGLGDEATMVTYGSPKTPKEIDSIVLLARKGDSIVEMIHARGVDPERVADTAKKALPKLLAVL